MDFNPLLLVHESKEKYLFLMRRHTHITYTYFCRYLFLFLKFMASVIPTIEYDYTMDFDLGSSSN